MNKTVSATCAVALFAGTTPVLATDNIEIFGTALKGACQVWMEGAERKALSNKLQTDGWDAMSDAIFAKSGDWGRVTVTLQQPSGESSSGSGNWMKTWVDQTYGKGTPPPPVKRSCDILYSTNDEPWGTGPAIETAATWIANAFPSAAKLNSVSTAVGGQPADGALWGDGKVKITQIAYKAKQSAPGSDLILRVENE
jgi:hypothetical protein